ncbi:cytochrome b [Rhizosaccharibacter radicis]|uniref:Cytochrome b/b6 domain-containing protein n=1 Tax=Rhizosaccharibacter radicis TaxID=2782605 RepID=A0ABT1VWV4_9PROT|nr:cytochrome b/b6 domain-containing protein [Acetobacteraceae bacterium KSS12]
MNDHLPHAAPFRWDAMSRRLHWLTAVLVMLQFGLAELWDRPGRELHHLMVVWHMSFGILLSIVLLARIAWRLLPKHRRLSGAGGLAGLAARGMHLLLYVLLLAQVVLGYALRWSGSRPLSFFGLPIPSPVSPAAKPLRHLLLTLHDWGGWALIALAAAHAAAAAWEHLVLKHDTLRRMLPFLRAS